MPPKKRVQILALLLLLAACQPATAPRVRLVIDGQIREIAAGDLIPAHMLADAAVAFSPVDRVLMDGIPVPMDSAIQQQGTITLQLRRAVPVTLIAPTGQITVNTAASTVGEALLEAGVELFVSDRVEPPVDTPIAGGMLVTITPGREVTFQAGGKSVRVRSSAATVGQAAAEAGIPLIGLDTASPSENDALPSDGQIRIVRVTESTSTAYKTIPYETELIVTTELEPPLQDVLDPGEIGLSLNRTRVRYEDGAETGRVVESESVIRLPRARVVRSSYWRAIQMYATVYSPCESGTGGCSYGTASGASAGKGIVAVDPSVYSYLVGARVFIPGYGTAVIGDIGGGYIIEQNLGIPRTSWIDLGFNDGEIVDMTGWVTVYFLAPAPLEIPWFLK